MIQRGGPNRKDAKRGPSYYDHLKIKVYDKKAAESMPMKEFAVQHIRAYEAALFLDLASEWPAISKWNFTYFCDNFKDLVEFYVYPKKDKQSTPPRDYCTCSQFISDIKDIRANDTSHIYQALNGIKEPIQSKAMLENNLP